MLLMDGQLLITTVTQRDLANQVLSSSSCSRVMLDFDDILGNHENKDSVFPYYFTAHFSGYLIQSAKDYQSLII